jgi:hypothetical protein
MRMSDEIHEIQEPDLNEGQQFHTIIGQDPWLEEFARNPYDPLNSARATGRLTGLAARHVYRKGWMRVAAFLVGLTMVSGSFAFVASEVAAGSIVRAVNPTNLVAIVVIIPVGIVGIRLIVHAFGRKAS